MIIAENVKIVLNGQSIARVAKMAEDLGFTVASEEDMLDFITEAVNKTQSTVSNPKGIELSDLVEHVIYEITYYWFRQMSPTKERTQMMDQLYADAKFEFRFRPKGSALSLVGSDITFPVGLYKAIMASDDVVNGL